jgi:hypothetical protein
MSSPLSPGPPGPPEELGRAAGPHGEVALRRPNDDLLLDGRLVARQVTAAAWGSTGTD